MRSHHESAIAKANEKTRQELLKTDIRGVDGRVKHGHDEVGGWVIGYDGWYNTD
jgi:hypothetical protein